MDVLPATRIFIINEPGSSAERQVSAGSPVLHVAAQQLSLSLAHSVTVRSPLDG